MEFETDDDMKMNLKKKQRVSNFRNKTRYENIKGSKYY